MAVARHRFGCRVPERLVEHGTAAQMASLCDQCAFHAEELSRHEFGNFVVQSLLEHGTSQRRRAIVQQLLPTLPQLACHRTASHVVQKAVNYSGEQGRWDLASALLQAHAPHSFAEVAATRYGSFVVEELRSVLGGDGLGMEAQRLLAAAPMELRELPDFQRVAVKYGLM